MRLVEILGNAAGQFKKFVDEVNTIFRMHNGPEFVVNDVAGKPLVGSYGYDHLLLLARKNGLTNKKVVVDKGSDRECYNNSMEYAEQHPDVDLCWGWAFKLTHPIEYYLEDLEDRIDFTSISIVEHAFCMKNGIVLDATWAGPAYYSFEVIPKRIWSSFGGDDIKFIKYIKTRH